MNRGRRRAVRAGLAVLGFVLAVWSLIPPYNMLLIALSDEGNEFTGAIWPDDFGARTFSLVWSEGDRYLENFWHQFGNSIFIGLAVMGLTVAIGSMASFALGRTRRRRLSLIGHLALLTYVLPASILVIPFTHIISVYGLMDSLWSVIAAQTAFATPVALLIFHQYGRLIPLELDEAARVDGASPWQVYLRVYLPLMAPALVPVATFALLLAWNDYLYQFLLLSSPRSMTVAAAIDQFFDSDEAPWNEMMAIALIYAVPPVAIYFGLSRFMVSGLTAGGVKA